MSYEEILLKLKDKSDQFSNSLTELNNANNDLKNKTETILKKLSELKGRPVKTCSVCYTRECTHALVPCGHTFDQNCATRALSRNRCFMCRGEVESILRVFVS